MNVVYSKSCKTIDEKGVRHMHPSTHLSHGAFIVLFGALVLLVAPTHAAGNRYFPETGFIVDAPLLSAFDHYGGVPIIGLPISDAMETTCEGHPCVVQWF